MNALVVSSRINNLLTHEEAEFGAVTADDLGKLLTYNSYQSQSQFEILVTMVLTCSFVIIEAEEDDG